MNEPYRPRAVAAALKCEIQRYLDLHFPDKSVNARQAPARTFRAIMSDEAEASAARALPVSAHRTLEDVLSQQTESFSERLFRFIDEKGLKDSDVYKRANIDRKLFSKIRTARDYRPSKQTAVALAFALGLGPDDALDLLGKAGYTLSEDIRADLIVRFFLERGNCDLYALNDALYTFGQPLIGV